MSQITSYLLRGASVDALHAQLVDAGAGMERPYAWIDQAVQARFDAARVRLPWPETMPGDPVTDESGATYQPDVPTGNWLVAVSLVDEVSEALASVAISVSGIES